MSWSDVLILTVFYLFIGMNFRYAIHRLIGISRAEGIAIVVGWPLVFLFGTFSVLTTGLRSVIYKLINLNETLLNRWEARLLSKLEEYEICKN